MISTHFFYKKALWVHVINLMLSSGSIQKNPSINSWDIIAVRVLIICVAFSTCSVVVVGGGGDETIGVNGVPTLLAEHELVLFDC